MRVIHFFSLGLIMGCLSTVQAGPLPVDNYSFENPVIIFDPEAYPVDIWVTGWTKIDPSYQNTGVFLNLPGSPTYITNAVGNQLAFICNLQDIALAQDTNLVYQAGSLYRLVVGVYYSVIAPPPPGDYLTLVLYYHDETGPHDIASTRVYRESLGINLLRNFSVNLPKVSAGDAWAGKQIGIALRGSGENGGFWDVDNVRLWENPPDFDNNNLVDLVDLAAMAGEWLSTTNPNTDLTGDGTVNLLDLQVLQQYWLENL